MIRDAIGLACLCVALYALWWVPAIIQTLGRFL